MQFYTAPYGTILTFDPNESCYFLFFQAEVCLTLPGRGSRFFYCMLIQAHLLMSECEYLRHIVIVSDYAQTGSSHRVDQMSHKFHLDFKKSWITRIGS